MIARSSDRQLPNISMKRTVVVGAVMTLLAFALPVYAQVAITPYWCGSYWSSTPCTYGGYGGSHTDDRNPEYSYYTFPNQYYPSNYNFYYPYQSYQYYPQLPRSGTTAASD